MTQAINILMIEDNEGDILLTKEAFNETKILNSISAVKDGEAALDYLFKRNGYEEVVLPDVILLDINIPKISGHEVLKVIKQDAGLRKIPVVMITSSEAVVDIEKAYDNHVNCYITKPVDLEKFIQVVKKIESFWLQLVKLPGKN